ncbi:MAG: hypothetical protein A2Y12_09670 [Planctomycetes bacterium GWF2_42_9]|nr:MAG: hypothetical protein A2Y12_09670 [Planctomycetes bacterium GWF2_42_9]
MTRKQMFYCIMVLFFAGLGRADFDADNFADVFTIESGTVKWYERVLNSNSAAYLSQISTNTAAVAIGNLDGDLYTDVIIGKTGTNNSSCWYEANETDNTLTLVSSSLIGWVIPNGAAIGDYDNDGAREIFLVGTNGNVTRYECTGNDAVSSLGTLTGSATAVATGNLDGDSYDDLLIGKSGGINWYENNAWKRQFGTDCSPKTLLLTNIDGDPNGDLLLITSGNVAKWLEGSTNDVNPVSVQTFDSSCNSIGAADVDNDGICEVMLTHSVSAVTWWEAYQDDYAPSGYLALARNTIHTLEGIQLSTAATEIKGGKIDSDGLTDIVVIENGNAKWFESDRPDNRLTKVKTFGTNVQAVACGNFDNDYYTDLIVACTGTSKYTQWYEHDVNDDSYKLIKNDLITWTKTNGIGICDYDADGNPDLFIVGSNGNANRYEATGDNAYTSIGTLTSGAISCTGGDLDGDSYDDLLITKSGGIYWWESSTARTTFGDTSALGLALGNIDGDTYPDLLVVTSGNAVKWYEANGNNATPVYRATISGASSITSAAIFDIDDDGTNEVVLTKSSGATLWYESPGNDRILATTGGSAGSSATGIAGGFFDKDIKSDAFVVNSSGSVDWYEFIDDNRLAYVKDVTTIATSVAAGNFDNDNKYDLIVGKTSATSWYEADNTNGGSTLISSTMAGVSSANKIAIGKIDKDAYGDVLLIDSSGNVHWYEATGNGTYTERSSAVTTGAQAVTIGDFDRDSLTDVFIAKSSTLSRYEATGSDNTLALVRSYDSIANAKALALGNLRYEAEIYGADDLLVVDVNDAAKWYETPDFNNLDYKSTLETGASSVLTADIDADGKVEIMVTHASSAPNWYEYDPQQVSVISRAGSGISAGCSTLAALGFTCENMTLPAKISDSICYPSYDDVYFPAMGVKETYGWDRIRAVNSFGSHPTDEWPLAFQSLNYGSSWSGASSFSIGPLNWLNLPEESNAIALGFSATLVNARLFTGTVGFVDRNGTTSTQTCNITFTSDVAEAYFHRGVIMLDNGNLLANMYIKWSGQNYFTSVVVESSDRGLNWTYKSTLASRPGGVTNEGPSESCLVKLSNGNVLGAARMGEPMVDSFANCELVIKISTDGGATWATLTSMGVSSVDPFLLQIDNGQIVLSYGRPGAHLKLSDANGQNWSEPFADFFGPGCGYTSMVKNAIGDILFFYTESNFQVNNLQTYGKHVNHQRMTRVAMPLPATPLVSYGTSPRTGGTNVPRNYIFQWVPGKNTDSSDVYFGTNFNNVKNATTASAEYKGNVYGGAYTPATLAANTTYYWRIDGRNSSGVTTGYVRSFTTGS